MREFKKVCSVLHQGDIAVIKSLLDSNEIKYYIKNEDANKTFTAAYFGRMVAMEVFVEPSHENDAKILLRNFIDVKEVNGLVIKPKSKQHIFTAYILLLIFAGPFIITVIVLLFFIFFKRQLIYT